MIDSIGSTAEDCLVEEIRKHVRNRANQMGSMSSSPVSEGMSGLPLPFQQVLFSQLPAEKIDVHLTSSHMMVPFKSSSMIYSLGKVIPRWSKGKVCRACHLYKHCLYKIAKQS